MLDLGASLDHSTDTAMVHGLEDRDLIRDEMEKESCSLPQEIYMKASSYVV